MTASPDFAASAAIAHITAHINITVTPYEGTDFPEAERWASYAQAAIADAHDGYMVEVEEGRANAVHAYDAAGERDDDLSEAVLSSLTDLWEAFCADGYKAHGATPGDADGVGAATAYIVASLGTPSMCVETVGAMDYDVMVRIGDDGDEVAGEVTLCPHPRDGMLGMWGDLDNWLSGSLVAVVRALGKAAGDALADAIATACVGDDALVTIELEDVAGTAVAASVDGEELGGEG
jgi:hypothetical protein